VLQMRFALGLASKTADLGIRIFDSYQGIALAIP